MSGPLEQSLLYAATDDFGSQLSSFDSGLDGHAAQISGPPAPYSGVGFWYRPEPQEVFFHHHASQLNHPTSVSEQTVPVKHRRTRSGCFTCRSRRVKCDETRPVCDRCRKGNRECVFPQATSASKRMKEDAAPEPGTVMSHDHRRQSAVTLEAIQDDSDEGGPTSPQDTITRPGIGRSQTSTMSRKQKYRQDSIASHAERSPTPSDPESVTSKTQPSPLHEHSPPPRALAARWSHLKQNEQELFQFQLDNMTRYHYFLRLDPTDFIHVGMIDLALGFEPLFYAVLAFASYHREMQAPDGVFKEFWKYYCRSIVQLRRWLETHSERHDAVLLTVLQLAAFEEYLGDWPSLVCHHRAAYSILVSLYTPDTITSTETSRMIFDWIGRLDIISSLMAGADTVLQRPWFAAALTWYQGRYQADEVDPQKAIEYFCANLRLIGFDMASAFANAQHSPNFATTAATISERMDRIRLEMQTLHDTAGAMSEIQRTDSADGERSPGAFDARVPLFSGELWPLNFVWLDWYGGMQMHLYQTAKILHERAQSDPDAVATLSSAMLATASEILSPVSPFPSSPPSKPTATLQAPTQTPGIARHVVEQLTQLSTVQCYIYEGIERRSSAPNGAVLGCHIGMGFSTVFLRREPGLTMWARKKLANVERMGYVWPATFRTSMALLWNAPEVVEWWLPDGSGPEKPPLIDEIRAVVEDRNRELTETGGAGVATGAGGGPEKDQTRTDLRDLRAIFDNLDLGIPARLLDHDVHGADGEPIGSPRPER